jgi:aminoglycoside N3'-acetyltransferase
MVKQKNHMDQQNRNLSVTEVKDASEQEAVREYVDAIENNVEYFKEWAAIYQTQRDLARSKVSQLEMKVMQLQEIIRQLTNK